MTDGSGNRYRVDKWVLANAARLSTEPTTFEVGERRLAAIGDSLGYGDKTTTLVQLFRELGTQCNAQPTARAPRWSGIGDDCSPFEFSIEMKQKSTELRMLVEAHDDPASPATYWNSGMRLNNWLSDNYECYLEAFRSVQDLFEPRHGELFGVVGHGCGLNKNGRPAFKIYVNPLAHGLGRDADIVSEALHRLGCREIVEKLMPLRGPLDFFSHFSLDLSADEHARVKIYIKHFNTVPADLDLRETAVNSTTGDEWGSFCRAMLGDRQLSQRPIYTAYTVTAERPDRIETGVVQLPIMPYVENDQLAFDRILVMLHHHDLPADTYVRVLERLRERPLQDEQGLHSHVSYSRQAGAPRIAVYFGSRIYTDRYGWLSLDPARSWPDNCWPSPGLRRVPYND